MGNHFGFDLILLLFFQKIDPMIYSLSLVALFFCSLVLETKKQDQLNRTELKLVFVALLLCSVPGAKNHSLRMVVTAPTWLIIIRQVWTPGINS